MNPHNPTPPIGVVQSKDANTADGTATPPVASGKRSSVTAAATPTTASTIKKKKKKGSIDERWQKMFEKLVAYKAQHGDTKVPSNYSEIEGLSMWTKKQREMYKSQRRTKRISSRIDKLIGIDFDFQIRPSHDDNFAARIAELRRYKAKHGNCNVKEDDTTFPGLGKWVAYIRQQHSMHQMNRKMRSMLTVSRRQQLTALEFDFERRVQSSVFEAPPVVATTQANQSPEELGKKVEELGKKVEEAKKESEEEKKEMKQGLAAADASLAATNKTIDRLASATTEFKEGVQEGFGETNKVLAGLLSLTKDHGGRIRSIEGWQEDTEVWKGMTDAEVKAIKNRLDGVENLVQSPDKKLCADPGSSAVLFDNSSGESKKIGDAPCVTPAKASKDDSSVGNAEEVLLSSTSVKDQDKIEQVFRKKPSVPMMKPIPPGPTRPYSRDSIAEPDRAALKEAHEEWEQYDKDMKEWEKQAVAVCQEVEPNMTSNVAQEDVGGDPLFDVLLETLDRGGKAIDRVVESAKSLGMMAALFFALVRRCLEKRNHGYRALPYDGVHDAHGAGPTENAGDIPDVVDGSRVSRASGLPYPMETHSYAREGGRHGSNTSFNYQSYHNVRPREPFVFGGGGSGCGNNTAHSNHRHHGGARERRSSGVPRYTSPPHASRRSYGNDRRVPDHNGLHSAQSNRGGSRESNLPYGHWEYSNSSGRDHRYHSNEESTSPSYEYEESFEDIDTPPVNSARRAPGASKWSTHEDPAAHSHSSNEENTSFSYEYEEPLPFEDIEITPANSFTPVVMRGTKRSIADASERATDDNEEDTYSATRGPAKRRRRFKQTDH